MLDDPNGSTTSGTEIIQSQFIGEREQDWLIVSLADGHDLIVNASSGLAIAGLHFSQESDTPLIQSQLDGGLDQQWNLIPLASGRIEVVNASSGLALDDANDSISNGTVVQLQPWSGGLNQGVSDSHIPGSVRHAPSECWK